MTPRLPADPRRLKHLLDAACRAMPGRVRDGEAVYERTGGVYVRSNRQVERARAHNRLAHARDHIGQATQALFEMAHDLHAFAAGRQPEAAPDFLPPWPTRSITKAQLRKTGEWWKGKKLVLTRPVRTWQATLETGRRVTVTRKFKGFKFRTAFCGHCGTAFHASKIPAHYFAWPPGSDN